ncbi:hypothetical protein HDV05_004816 [Chytridiales sp. JEL 0842]|nr:hypothetical protein HDV05_004816 [Chytridiales sp. JEL 0842]
MSDAESGKNGDNVFSSNSHLQAAENGRISVEERRYPPYAVDSQIPSVVTGSFLTSTHEASNNIASLGRASTVAGAARPTDPSSSAAFLERIPYVNNPSVDAPCPIPPAQSSSNPFLSPAGSSLGLTYTTQQQDAFRQPSPSFLRGPRLHLEDNELTMSSIQLMALRELAAASSPDAHHMKSHLEEDTQSLAVSTVGVHRMNFDERSDMDRQSLNQKKGGNVDLVDGNYRRSGSLRGLPDASNNNPHPDLTQDNVEIVVGGANGDLYRDGAPDTDYPEESKSIVGDVFLDEMIHNGLQKAKARRVAGADTDSDSHVTHQAHKRRAAKASREKMKNGSSTAGNVMSDFMDATKMGGNNKRPSDNCAICDRPLPRPIEAMTLAIKGLKPRFVRELKRTYPLRSFQPNDRICIKDVHNVMQIRIEQLLEEDQTQLSRLQDDAMRNLGDFELQEQNWQKQFERGWTVAEKAADVVARFGGSWKFIIALIGFLASWMSLNGILNIESIGKAWDPFPFILLNLFLSSLAAFQAPIIMMSQNRQSQLDRLQNDYVSKIILRAEHQVRHVNAKVDFLLSHQWKRLLEIQEIQIDLLQTLQSQSRRLAASTKVSQGVHSSDPAATGFLQPMSPNIPPTMEAATVPRPLMPLNRVQTQYWSMETSPDEHVRMLLAHHYGSAKSAYDDTMIFAHWHTDGDNFMGYVENVRFEVRHPGVIKRITYDIGFNDPQATLDDVFSGEGMVTLRNDLDLKHMNLVGRLVRIEIHAKDRSPVTFANGDLPSRYKPTFFLKRGDKITDFWKAHINRLNLTYSPPYQAAVLALKPGQIVRNLRVDFLPSAGVCEATVLMKRIEGSSDISRIGAGVGGTGPSKKKRRQKQLQQQTQAQLQTDPGAVSDAPSYLSPKVPTAFANNNITNNNFSDAASVTSTNSVAQMQPIQEDPLSYLRDVIGPRPVPEDTWKHIAHAEWPENSIPASSLPVVAGSLSPGGGPVVNVMLETGVGGKDIVLTESTPVTVYLEEVLVGPAVYVFLCDETRVAYHGQIEEILEA